MKLHHTGFIVKDIERFSQNMVGEGLVHIIEDPVQNARLALYKNHSDVYIELIQPLNEQSFTWNFLQKNGEGFHHFCYEATPNEIENIVQQKKLIKILGPVPALLFDNRNVVFYVDRNKMVVEFLVAIN